MYVVTHVIVFFLLPVGVALSILNRKTTLERLKPRLTRLLLAIVGKHYRVEGRQAVDPGRRYLIISNYPTFYTPFVLMALFPRASFIADAFMSRIPLLGHFMALNGAIFVDKANPRRSMQAIDAALERGTASDVIIFPEGGRTPDGEIHAFKRGFVYILKHSTLDLLPVTLNGFYRLKPKSRFYVDPDAELEVIVHHFVDNAAIKKMTDQEVLEMAGEMVKEGYRS